MAALTAHGGGGDGATERRGGHGGAARDGHGGTLQEHGVVGRGWCAGQLVGLVLAKGEAGSMVLRNGLTWGAWPSPKHRAAELQVLAVLG